MPLGLPPQKTLNLLHPQSVHHFTSKLFSESGKKKCYPNQVERAEHEFTVETFNRHHLDHLLVADSVQAAQHPSVDPQVSTHLCQAGL